MILKLRTVDEAWVYYSIAGGIKVRGLTTEQYKNISPTDNTSTRVEVSLKNLEGKSYCVYDGELKVIRFKDTDTNIGNCVIYTNLIVYLLNDEGKTIERIN